jgi:hypothetical protein
MRQMSEQTSQTTVPQIASVHEQTVISLSRGELVPIKGKKARRKGSKSSKVTVDRVNTMLLAYAKELIDNSTYSRFEIVNANLILIK